jgi:D-arabinose 1-dehydrogenase-like Zn-dependent alcohol dehydrogenase
MYQRFKIGQEVKILSTEMRCGNCKDCFRGKATVEEREGARVILDSYDDRYCNSVPEEALVPLSWKERWQK